MPKGQGQACAHSRLPLTTRNNRKTSFLPNHIPPLQLLLVPLGLQGEWLELVAVFFTALLLLSVDEAATQVSLRAAVA